MFLSEAMCVMAALLGLSPEFPLIVVHNREEARMLMCSMHPVACNPIPLPLSSISKAIIRPLCTSVKGPGTMGAKNIAAN